MVKPANNMPRRGGKRRKRKRNKSVSEVNFPREICRVVCTQGEEVEQVKRCEAQTCTSVV